MRSLANRLRYSSHAERRLEHVPPVHQAGIVDLQDEAGVDDREVFLAQRLGEREDELLVGLVVLVVDEVIEPAGREHAEERLVDRPRRRCAIAALNAVDLLRDAPRCPSTSPGRSRSCARAPAASASRRARRRSCRCCRGRRRTAANSSRSRVKVRVEPVSPGLERPRLEAGEMAAVIGDVARLPEFAIADAVDADVELPADHIIEPGRDRPSDRPPRRDRAGTACPRSRAASAIGRRGWCGYCRCFVSWLTCRTTAV